jgi:hypothetical protein
MLSQSDSGLSWYSIEAYETDVVERGDKPDNHKKDDHSVQAPGHGI